MNISNVKDECFYTAIWMNVSKYYINYFKAEELPKNIIYGIMMLGRIK